MERTNGPNPETGNIWYAVLVTKVNNNSNFVIQLAMNLEPKVYIRSCMDGKWGTWRSL